MKQLIFWCVAGFCLALFACNIKITGKVTDSKTANAISGAKISTVGTATTTDANGNYALKLPKSALNKYNVDAEFKGFQKQSKLLTTQALDFALMPNYVPLPAFSCDIKQRINALPNIIAPAEARQKEEKNQRTDNEVPMGNRFVMKTTKDVFEEKNLQQLILFNPNSDVIWPGALVRLSSVRAGSPALINIPRNPINVWVNLSHTNDSILANNIEPRGGTVHAAINGILANGDNLKGYAALMTYDKRESFQSDQVAIHFEINASWISGSVSNIFNSRSNNEKNVVIVEFLQNYYKSVYDPPINGNADIFKTLDESTCNSVFNVNDPPCYISEVNYGRMVYFKIESTSTFKEIKDSLEASFTKVDVNATMQTISILKDLNIAAYVAGGSPEDGVKAVTTNDFATLIRSNPRPSPQSPGIPLSFVVKDVKNNNLVAVQTSSQFTEYNTTPLKRKIRVVLEKMVVDNDGDNFGAGEFVWRISANDVMIHEQGNYDSGNGHASISTHGTFPFNNVYKEIEVDYTLSDKVAFKAEIQEIDDSDPNDVIPTIFNDKPITDFNDSTGKIIHREISGDNNGDPKVTLYFKYELIATYPK